jgi:hypothetical protein
MPFLFFLLFNTIIWIIPISILFGLAAMLFPEVPIIGALFSKYTISSATSIRGGIVFASAIYFTGATKYLGLGVPIIIESFLTLVNIMTFTQDFVYWTLGAGFKGGEVTPAVFYWSHIRKRLIHFCAIASALLAGMGFVFWSYHTPIACTVMGIELFGIESGLFVGLACFIAYLASPIGIYHSQIVKAPSIFCIKIKKREIRQLLT